MADSTQIDVRLGPVRVLAPDGWQGLHYFADGRLAMLEHGPGRCAFLMAGGITTVLVRGRALDELEAATTVLTPGGPGDFDNGYAGINAVHRDPDGRLLAFYHAEDQEGMPSIGGGIPGFYSSIGLAVSDDHGRSFRRAGRVLTGHAPKDPAGRPDQGLGEPSLTPDSSGRFLYLYYTSHVHSGGRGVDICLARCPTQAAGTASAWHKFHGGAFNAPGLGGPETPVFSDGIFPHVTYVPGPGLYLMIYCVNAFHEFESTPERSGIYIAWSADGITWARQDRQQLVRGYTIPRLGKEVFLHPTLVPDPGKGDGYRVSGTLCFGYSAAWGHTPTHTPHHLAGASVQIRFVPGTTPDHPVA
jgi:hypothetical protein